MGSPTCQRSARCAMAFRRCRYTGSRKPGWFWSSWTRSSSPVWGSGALVAGRVDSSVIRNPHSKPFGPRALAPPKGGVTLGQPLPMEPSPGAPAPCKAMLLLCVTVPATPEEVPASPLARALVRLVLAALSALPTGLREAMARWVGGLIYFLGIRRQLTLDQLGWAFPALSAEERRGVARRTYQHMATAALDAALSQKLSSDALAGAVLREESLAIERALQGGRGALLATGHFGNWELLGEGLTRQGIPLHAVVRPLKGAFNAEVVAGRVRAGMRLISPRNALRGALTELRRNQAVAVLFDQAIGGKHALFVPFFGRPAATTPLLSMAAMLSGAPVLVVLARRVGSSLHVHVEGPFPVPSTGDRARDLWTHTATLTEVVERQIRGAPDQWLWLHRRWKLPPPPEEALRLELLALAADDERVRRLLAEDGRLSDGYAPDMEAIHR